MKTINSRNIHQHRAEQGQADEIVLYRGKAKDNLTAKEPIQRGESVILPVKKEAWEGSVGQKQLYSEIRAIASKYKGAAQVPSNDEIEALVEKMMIDITRRAQEAGDLTSIFATELNLQDANEVVTVKWLYKYIGKMGLMAGSNDSVPLIEQKLGNTDTFPLEIKACGWKDTLANLLYNKVHEMAKVNQAAADADTDDRNAAIVGMIVGATYVASQKQAADTTAGATFDIKMYNTIRKAIKKLRGLKDPQTNRKINVPSIVILCNSADRWDLERVIGGQLTNGGANGTLTTQNAQALPVTQIVEYDQGITDGYVWGKDELSFPGVTAGTCYILVPKEYLWVVNKRPLTLETGDGETLQLSTEERAWYRVYGVYSKDFLGSSYAGTALGAGYGAVVETTLPTDS